MAGGLIDELFVAIGFKIDAQEINNLENKISKFLKKLSLGFEILGKTFKNDFFKKLSDSINDYADKSSEQFAKIVEGFEAVSMIITPIITGIVAIGAATAVTVGILDKMSDSLLKNNQSFVNFSRQTGLNVGQMQKIATAGMISDYTMTPESVMSSVQAVQSNLAKIPLGQGNVAPYQMLGISPIGKDAFQVIDELREKIKGLSDMQATNIIQDMGFSPEFITILRMTKDQLAEVNSLMLSPEQRNLLQQYGMQMRIIHMRFELLKDKALIAIMPYLMQFMQGVEHIGRAFAPFLFEIGKTIALIGTPLLKALYHITMAFIGLLDILLIILKPLNFLMEIMGKFITDHPKIISALAGIGFALMAWLNPALAGVTALLLLLEDLAVWAMGGKSFIGTTIDIAGGKLKELGDWLGGGLGNIGKGIMPNNTLQQASATNTAGSASANFQHNQNLTQNVHNHFPSATPESVAVKTNDLLFAYMQVDRTV